MRLDGMEGILSDDLTGGLDLLGDWLDAKGYGEEAGLCTRVMDFMHKQDARIAALEAEVADLNECLTLAHMDGFEKGRDAARAAMEDK